ncbi:MAG: glycine cleavage T C-terminal barrel domain-containing protein, partial [Steroidobacteraceae bacterium]
EKSYRLVGREMSIEYAALESGLDRFVHPNKGDFVGRDALVAWRERGFANRFVTLEVHGVTDADPLGNEPIFTPDGRLVGRATSGYYGHCLRKSLSIGYVKPEFAAVGTELLVEVLGERRRATVLVDSPYDPQNNDLRA